jgi:hypothetical protein
MSERQSYKSDKSKSLLLSGKVSKNGGNTDWRFLLLLQKRRNRVLPFLQTPGFPAKSRFLLFDEQNQCPT